MPLDTELSSLAAALTTLLTCSRLHADADNLDTLERLEAVVFTEVLRARILNLAGTEAETARRAIEDREHTARPPRLSAKSLTK